MIHAGTRLFGMLRGFVEQELRGIITWDDVAVVPGELAPLGKYNRRNPLGAYKEIAGVIFRDYEVTVKSSEEAPPLGLIQLRYHDLIDTGPLDQTTWTRLGKFIRDNEAKCHGSRRKFGT